MKYALVSVPGLADIGVLHRGWEWPQDPTQVSGEVRRKFQMTNFTMPDNSCSMKYALKLVPGPADVGVPPRDGDGPSAPPRCPWGPEKFSNN